MSAITYLALERVQALGSLSVNFGPDEPVFRRAQILIDMAAEQVLTYIGMTMADALLLTAQQQGVLATVIADLAASVVGHNQTKSTGAYEMDDTIASLLLTAAQRDILDRAFPGTRSGSMSLVVERDENTSWFAPYGLIDTGFDVIP